MSIVFAGRADRRRAAAEAWKLDVARLAAPGAKAAEVERELVVARRATGGKAAAMTRELVVARRAKPGARAAEVAMSQVGPNGSRTAARHGGRRRSPGRSRS